MSEIDFGSRTAGPQGTATARALDKNQDSSSLLAKAREARVQELKQQYQSGQYRVDSVELSSSIVSDLLKQSR